VKSIITIIGRAAIALALATGVGAMARRAPAAGGANLPVYDHIVIVIEENKDYQQIVGSAAAPYINGTLKSEGASLTQMYAEEHHSEGNYFWLFSGSNQQVGFRDDIPRKSFSTSNLGQQLIAAGLTFKGYSEDLPVIGSKVSGFGLYARKHVPWVAFSNLPDGTTATDSSNLRFQDFPLDYTRLPTVAFVIPNLINDMHNASRPSAVATGDTWLREHMDRYYQWSKTHNSLLILTFDENAHGPAGPTDPAAREEDDKNRIATIFAGAHIKHGDYPEGKGVTHVNLLRTLEAMYKLPKSGAQYKAALAAGISDDYVITDIFEGK
jgi:phosphatidylinositol-3-phosphatase